MDQLGADAGDIADEAERRIGRRHRQQPRVLARNADRDRLVAGLAVDRRDQVAVDLADQHHAHDLERLGVGDAKAVPELRLLADAAEHRVDLRPAAVDQHAAHADAAQQQHVLRQREVGLAVDRRAAELHDHRLAGELPDVGQRLDEDAARFRRARHDVLLILFDVAGAEVDPDHLRACPCRRRGGPRSATSSPIMCSASAWPSCSMPDAALGDDDAAIGDARFGDVERRRRPIRPRPSAGPNKDRRRTSCI